MLIQRTDSCLARKRGEIRLELRIPHPVQPKPRSAPSGFAIVAVGTIDVMLPIDENSVEHLRLGVAQAHADPEDVLRLGRGREPGLRPGLPAGLGQPGDFIDRQPFITSREILHRGSLSVGKGVSSRGATLQPEKHIGKA